MADSNIIEKHDDPNMKKFVTVRTSGTLYELGNISGPILNPVWLELDVIWTLLVNRREVCEHCITDPQKYIKLTKSNYDDFNLYPGNTEIIDPTVAPNTYVVTVDDIDKDDTPETVVAGKMYVEIL